MIETVEARQLLSTSWFVSPTGSSQNPGTAAAPFATVQAAANVARAGDYVEIEAGVYRETVVPAHVGAPGAPITFEAYNHEPVTITGADVLTGWTSIGAGVFQTHMSVDLGEGNNQIFVDGQALNEARFPNTSLDLSHPTLETADKVTLGKNSATIFDANLSQPRNYWAGAVIHLTAGQEWVAQTGTVTASSPGQLTFSYRPNSQYELPSAGNRFYLTGTLHALDGAGEWHRDPVTGTLTLSTPAGDDPGAHLVEAKARQAAFDLRGRRYITVSGVNIISAGVRTDGWSSHTVLDGLNAAYVDQFVSLPNGWAPPTIGAIQLNGPDSLLENSAVAFSSGDGVYVSGVGSRVTNCVIHDVDTSAADAAGIRDYAAASQLDHNTVYNTGRDGILHEAAGVQILNNTVHDFGLQTTDSGGIYAASFNGAGSVIAYNSVYSAHSGGYGQTALYCDNNSSNYVLHDNHTWDVDIALKFNFTSHGEHVYHNTLDATQESVFGNFQGSWSGTRIENNVFLADAHFGDGAVVESNATSTGVAGAGAASFVSGADALATALSQQGVSDVPPSLTDYPPFTGLSPVAAGAPAVATTVGPAVPATVPTTTTAAGAIDLAGDRAALAADILQRRTTLAQLADGVRADTLAYRAAGRQLGAARRSRKPSASPPASSSNVATLDTQVAQMLATLRKDRTILAVFRKADFTGIAAARGRIIADERALRAAAHASHT